MLYYILMLVVTALTYYIAISLLSSSVAILFGYKEGGVFFILTVFALIAFFTLFIVINQEVKTLLYFLLASLFVIGFADVHHRHKNVD